MINLGIVIAVSEYAADAKNLPACKRDGEAIAHILLSSGRFAEVLHLESETTASKIKSRLADFTKSHASSEVGELFFYFTGHGEFVGDEFYYLLTDYQSKKRNQTSLQNSELDGMIRALNPKLFVKVVDACHSGLSYIKSSSEFHEYLKTADQQFKKIYFMFSSQTEQFSYQNDKISYFTESVIKAVANHGSDKIRYKDVISYVSDDFALRGVQTPFFVTQADFTEVFCDLTATLRSTLESYVQEDEPLNEKSDPNDANLPGFMAEPVQSIATLAREEAKAFCTKEEAASVLDAVIEISTEQTLLDDLSELFERHVTADQTPAPAPGAIGTWLDQHRGERSYFAKPVREMEIYRKRVPKNPLMSAMGSFLNEDQYTYVDARREVITGFLFTTDMPFQHARIRLDPKLPNVAPEECYIVAILSRTHIRLFWSYSHFEYLDWEKSGRVGKLEWITSEAPLRDVEAVRELVKQVEAQFRSFVEEPLRAQWNPRD